MNKLTSIIRYSLLACFLSTVHAIAAQPGGQSVANAPQQSADVSQQRELFKRLNMQPVEAALLNITNF